MSTRRSRSSHDSKPTRCPVVADQYQPGKWHEPCNHRNGRTGTAASNLTVSGVHARHLDVRHGLVRPSRYGHTAPPECSPLTNPVAPQASRDAGAGLGNAVVRGVAEGTAREFVRKLFTYVSED
ncbi:hypothetical protein [Streptomyces anulatus]|uniref:hypothetical protein n=1 Tax=Streptomyces anulatus TaxID=1892 RepID=UPI003675E58A